MASFWTSLSFSLASKCLVEFAGNNQVLPDRDRDVNASTLTPDIPLASVVAAASRPTVLYIDARKARGMCAAFNSSASLLDDSPPKQYDPDFTQDISEKMRIPNTLKVASDEADGERESLWATSQNSNYHRAMVMEVPERIMVADSGQDPGRPSERGHRFSAEVPARETFHLQTPPRVLTLEGQALDYISLAPPPSASSPAMGDAPYRGPAQRRKNPGPRPYRERSLSERGPRLGTPAQRQQALDLVPVDDVGEDQYGEGLELDLAVVNRQVSRLTGRLLAVERAAQARQRREVLLFSLTGLVFLFNGWLWMRR